MIFDREFMLKATMKPKKITGGVTAKQNVRVNNKAL